MDWLLAALGTFINALILGWLARRVLGARVGWVRTFVISLIVNALAWPALTYLLRAAGATEDSSDVVVSLFSMLVAAWALGLEMVALTIAEAVAPTGSLPGPIAMVREAPAGWRRLRRTIDLWWILMRRGLTGATAGRDPDRLADSLRGALEEAGVTFVKFGQMLATRSDLLPETVRVELSKLQSNVTAAPWDEVEPTLNKSLPQPVSECFDTFDTTPFAAASVAQVYSARLLDGTDVVVKVQRPRALAQSTSDLDLLSRVAKRLDASAPWARRMDVMGLSEGFAASLREELDYRIEAGNMRAVAAACGNIEIPTTYPELSSRTVLVMDRVDGQPLSRAKDLLAQKTAEERHDLAATLFQGIMRQMLITGTFHADLHPGNILLTEEGLALLDFGSVGRLDRATRDGLALLLWAVQREDATAAIDALLMILERPDDLPDRELERDIGQVMLRLQGGAEDVFSDMLDVVMRYHFSVPPQLAGAFRAISALDGSLRLISADAHVLSLAQSELPAVLGQSLRPAALRQRAEDQLAAALPLLQRLPRRIDRITEQLESGTFSLRVATLEQRRERTFLGRIASQLSVSVLATATAIAGVMLIAAPTSPAFLPELSLWAFMGLWLLFVAFALGARVLIRVFQPESR